MDPAIREELDAFVEKRIAEGGAPTDFDFSVSLSDQLHEIPLQSGCHRWRRGRLLGALSPRAHQVGPISFSSSAQTYLTRLVCTQPAAFTR
jgi:hypothetical protein